MSAESPQAPLSCVLHSLPSKVIAVGLKYKELSLQFLDALKSNSPERSQTTSLYHSSGPSSLWQRLKSSLQPQASRHLCHQPANCESRLWEFLDQEVAKSSETSACRSSRYLPASSSKTSTCKRPCVLGTAKGRRGAGWFGYPKRIVVLTRR
jgi:predicted Zn-ribbon and HTH transcriptional regulator